MRVQALNSVSHKKNLITNFHIADDVGHSMDPVRHRRPPVTPGAVMRKDSRGGKPRACLKQDRG